VAGNEPERPPRGRLLEALSVRRNAAIGLAVGVALALAMYAVRVLELFGPAPDQGSPALFLALAVVLAASAGALVATALSVIAAVRLARQSPEE